MINIKRPVFLYPIRAVRSRWRKRCRGQTLVEYALILAIISVVLIGVIVNLGKQVTTIFSTVESQVAIAGSSH